MKTLFSKASVFLNGEICRRDLLVEDGVIRSVGENISSQGRAFVFENCVIFPGFVDVHVHFREPGFSYKETVRTGSAAALAGGFTSVCTMPNLNPPPDCAENLAAQTDIISRDALCRVYPYGTITMGERGDKLSAMDELYDKVIAFSDDGRGVQADGIMESAMINAKKYGKKIVAHCEDNSLLFGGYIHDGKYARAHGHKGICSESEWRQIERDISLVRKTGCAYHVCHISTRESVELIRRAKAEGLDVSCETAPHYLTLCEDDLREHGNFKMNPPLRAAEDRDALIEGICDGTVDMIATDHAPHSAEEKSRGLEKSAFGIVGLETAFPLLYTRLVMTGKITLAKLVDLLCINPSKRFGIGGEIKVGGNADFTVIDLNEKFTVEPSGFYSMGRATPFEGCEFYGRVKKTFVGGRAPLDDFR